MIPTNNTVPYEARPSVTLALIGICVAVFFYQMTLSEAEALEFARQYALVPARYVSSEFAAAHGLSQANPLPFVTNMFLHGGFMHILGNLWVLWVFGPALEDRLGPKKFLGLYLASGVAASLLHAVFNFGSEIPALGASGAIAGVIAGYARRFPYAWVNVFAPVGLIPFVFVMPAVAFGMLWFALQILQAAGSLFGSGAGIAWWAHVGGFVAGYLLVKRLGDPAEPFDKTRTMAQSSMWYLWPFRMWASWVRFWMRR